ncbi:unnamed protein product [Haemonchus placei]|uniref:Amyloid beta A4 precursor protein-binding family B member 1 n=1 Tax=Haemonchus placei TaxID=6290 RepID=A0A0N4WVV2_HAEPC|nr:unnamed protein product [Haemonchus placei]
MNGIKWLQQLVCELTAVFQMKIVQVERKEKNVLQRRQDKSRCIVKSAGVTFKHRRNFFCIQDDACWQTQHRVPPEVQPPQIGKISIPEFNDLHEVHKTVIVNKPQSYQKPKWNEFPEEVTPEIGAAPKVHTQEWNPVNQVRIYFFGFQEQNEVVKSTGWQRDSKIDRVWPPPEGETITSVYSGPQHMRPVQWPPAESEEHAQQQVEVLQKHIPAKKMEYQWPPPPPVYQGDSETNGFSA